MPAVITTAESIGAPPPLAQTFVREPRFDRPLSPLSASTWLPRHAQALGRPFDEVLAHRGAPSQHPPPRVASGHR